MAPPLPEDPDRSAMRGYGRASYGDGFADVYDDWYADVSPAAATAAFVAARSDGPVLELGSGTGRLAAPLRAAGLGVVGLDASTAMLARSVARHPRVPVVAADMAELPVRDGRFGAVLIAFNTLFNLASPAAQRRCLTQARRALAPGGVVVVEAFVPGDGAGDASDHVDVVRMEADLVVLRVSRTDPGRGMVAGHHVELRDGAPVRLRPWQLHFRSPEELDELAAVAGLRLDERFGGWDGEPFAEASPTHVSVYRAAEGPSLVSAR
ncbi:MAG TPA: class I SAM-dependent methyltransferase [Acidimicrobiales bacterium]|nr:class I SAM-dependent methyltransferase [Acidimicrobiales bacterium]